MRFVYLLLAVFLGPVVPVSARDICRDSLREGASDCSYLACVDPHAPRSGCPYLYRDAVRGGAGRRDDGHGGGRPLFAGPAGRHEGLRGAAAGRLYPPGLPPAGSILPLPFAAGWRTVCIAVVSAAAAFAAGCLLCRRRKLRRRQPPGSPCRKETPGGPDVRLPASPADELSVSLSLIDDACRRLLEYGPTDGFVRRNVDTIRRNARRIEGWLCSGEAGAAENADTPAGMADVAGFCGWRARAFEAYAGFRGISYRVEVAGEVLSPLARSALTLVVDTLLSAVFRRAQPGGEVVFRAAAVQQGLHIAVSARAADGVLVPTPECPSGGRPENPGREAPVSGDDAELAVCRGLVAKLRGEFRVLSDGDATTYALSLPGAGDIQAGRTAPEPEFQSVRYSGDALPAESGGALPAMLVINEDRDMIALIRELFAGEYNIAVIDDLDRAAGLLAVMSPQIILCGAAAHVGALDEIIRTIRRTRQLAQVPVILLSVGTRPDILAENPVPGADICLTLPFDLAHLRSVAAQLLHRYASHSECDRPACSAFDLAQGRMLHRDDKAFLDKMLGIIRLNILDPSLSTQFIAGEMGMSLPNFYRKLGGITQQTPACIVREYRLGMAEQLLVTTKLSIDEIIYKSGFSNRSTFFRGFVARFGCTPKTYRERKIRETMEAEAV